MPAPVRLLGLLLLMGCGRIGFGPVGDAGDPADADAGDAGDADARVAGDAGDASGDAAMDAGLDPDLVVWLPFDTDPSAGIRDVRGTLTNGRCVGSGCPTVVPGVVGGAYEFDGIDDYLIFDTSPTLDFGGSGQPFTATVWYNARDGGPAQQVVYAQATDSGDISFQVSFEDLLGGGTYDVVWKVCASSCPSENFATWVGGVDLNEWRFVAGVWTGSESILYVDGVEQARASTADVKFDGSPFMVGADWESGGSIEDFYEGLIDDLRVYRGALTVDEQRAIMSGS